MGYFGFRPYVSAAERRRKAEREAQKLRKKGTTTQPVMIEGRTIARTFWGKAWCDNLESYMDFENRLPRGRTYVRNGSVIHLDIQRGQVQALVSGSSIYRVKVGFKAAAAKRWNALCKECAGEIGSLVELLQGRFSNRVMGILTRKETGLFPAPAEIEMSCSCPDWATMCKHVAAVLYGVGARLDEKPELLFKLRSVNHEELITQAASVTELSAKATAGEPELAEGDLPSVFGIELEQAGSVKSAAPSQPATPIATPKSKMPAPPKAKGRAKSRKKLKTSAGAAGKLSAKTAVKGKGPARQLQVPTTARNRKPPAPVISILPASSVQPAPPSQPVA